jgi:hypothetical protein
MLNDIVSGISKELNEAFGDDIEIYTEQVKQGLKEPCFLISCVDHSSTQVVGNRYLRRNLFSIQYFPKSPTNAKAECLDVLDDLFLALEYITVDGKLVKGTGVNGQIIDGVLVVTISYSMFVRKVEPDEEPMETLEGGYNAR